MSSTFTPVHLGDEPKHWKSEIGLLNPESTSVAFHSIADLLLWLKTLSVDVDSNLTQFRALPKYAQLGKMQEQQAVNMADVTPRDVQTTATIAPPSVVSAVTIPESEPSRLNVHAPPIIEAGTAISPIQGFVPTRKVRERVGGGSAQVAALFGGLDEEEAGRVVARSSASSPAAPAPTFMQSDAPVASITDNSGFVPTRRVRQAPGGGSAQMAAIFGGN